MKTIIELGMILLLFAYTSANLPKIIRKARLGQVYLLKDSSSVKWGKAWVPR